MLLQEDNPETETNPDADPVVHNKIKAGYSDDSDKWNGKKFIDYLDQPVRKNDEVIHKKITTGNVVFEETITSKDFRQGDVSGSGFGAYRDGNGNAVVEADILKIRKEAVFNEAVINQTTFRIGSTIFTCGGCEIVRVEDIGDVIRCYYDNKDGQRYCGLVVDDQVRCQRYDPTQSRIIKYYWRLVMAVGDDYVDLSKTDVDGAGIPEVGDEIAQFGNRNDMTRQSAIVINPLDGGSVEVYAHINAYSLSEKNYVGMGVNSQTGEAYMYAYGDMFFGDRDLSDPSSSWITYQKKEGEARRKLRIKADVTFGAGSEGLSNLSEFKQQQQQIDDALKAAEEAAKAEFSSINLIDGTESITVTAPESANNYWLTKTFSEELKPGDSISIHIENIEILQGDSEVVQIAIYDSQIKSLFKSEIVNIGQNKDIVLTGLDSYKPSGNGSALLLYPAKNGATGGSSARFTKMMVVRGNKPCMTWAPSVNDQKQAAIDGVQVGGVNIVKRGNYGLVDSTEYRIKRVELNKPLVVGNTYTAIISGELSGSQNFVLYDYIGSAEQGTFKKVEGRIFKLTFKYWTNQDVHNILQLYNHPSPTNADNPADLDWLCLYDGDVKAPYTFVESIYDTQASIDAAKEAADAASAGVNYLKNFTDEAFSDGVVNRAEAAAIEKYTNSVTETKDAVDSAYETVYNNALLAGTAKSNLQAAKSTFDTAVADLLAAIQTAASDGIATPEEKSNVDAKYSAFNIAYGAFSTRIEEANKYIQTAINTTAQGAYQLSRELQTAVNNLTESIIPDLQDQIDKQIVSYNGTDVPTLDNYPANEWDDDAERTRHINDYYDRKITEEGGEVSYERYKFTQEAGVYKWIRIADSGAAEAQAKALEALGVANGKNKVYFGDSTPSVPYSINDVWIKTDGVIYLSNAERQEGATGSAADWQMVNDAQLRLRQMSSDGVISKEEKAALRNRLVQMQNEYASYQSDALTYGVSISALQKAYTNLTTFLTGTVAVNNDTDTTLSSEQRTAYNTYFAAYDTEVSRFTNLVADAIAQGKVDNLEMATRNLALNSGGELSFNSERWDALYLELEEQPELGVEYTLSWDDLQWEGAENTIIIRLWAGSYTGAIGVIATTEKGSGSKTITIPESYSPDLTYRLLFGFNSAGNTGFAKNVMWAKGNKQVPWTPALGDIRAAAEAAQKAADEAKADAAENKVQLDKWSSDAYISPTEKTALKQQQADIKAEYAEIIAGAGQYSVSTTAYASAYTAANNALTKYTAASPAEIPVEADYANIAAYYTARQTILDAIAQAAKGYVDGLEFSSINLIDGTESITVTAPESANNYWLTKTFSEELKPGDSISIHIENIEILQGDSEVVQIAIYDSQIKSLFKSEIVNIGQNKDIVLTGLDSYKPSGNGSALLLYPAKNGATGGSSARFTKMMVVRGNKPCMTWAPSVNDQKQAAIDGVQVGGVNIVKRGNYGLVDSTEYRIKRVELNKPLVVGNTYTAIISGELSGSQNFVLYDYIGSAEQGTFKKVEGRIFKLTFKYWTNQDVHNILQLYNHPSPTNADNPADLDWLCLYDGDVKAPYTFVESIYDTQASIDAAKQAADEAKKNADSALSSIEAMNNDAIFDISEKQSIRTQWETISGYSRTDAALDSLQATNGSYYRVRDMAKAAGISTAGLLAAVNSLRVKLNDYALYTSSNTQGFDRAGLAVLFTTYYAQEISVLNEVSAKYTDGKVEEVENQLSDYEYLKLVFPDATVDVNGVVLSRLMAVKNSSEVGAAVVAGMYGGGVDSLNNAGFKDPTHGILMMFAGSANIQSVASAKTRIYGDGSLFTSMLYANGGTIGGFTISADRLVSGNYNGGEDEMTLSKSLIKFRSSEYDSEVLLGATNVNPPSIGAFSCPVYIRNEHPNADNRAGIEISVSGALDSLRPDRVNAAIWVSKGSFVGFRPRSIFVNSSQYNLASDDSVIYADTTSSNVVFVLPTDPQPDQMYIIRKLYSNNSVSVGSSKHKIYTTGSNTPAGTASWNGRIAGIVQYNRSLNAWVLMLTYQA